MAEFMEIVKKRKKICDSYTECCKCPLYNFSCGLVGKGTDIITPNELEAFKKLEEAISNWEKSVDWSKVKVDTKILVRDINGEGLRKRHFAKFDNGKVYAWDSGTTSFTAYDDKYITAWQFAKLAEEGEADDE